jgi:hypothetical protein
MKIKEGFVLRTVDDMHIVVAVGKAAAHFNGMITLNETGAFLWKQLENGCDEQSLIAALCAAFEVDAETAEQDVQAFVQSALQAGLLDE